MIEYKEIEVLTFHEFYSYLTNSVVNFQTLNDSQSFTAMCSSHGYSDNITGKTEIINEFIKNYVFPIMAYENVIIIDVDEDKNSKCLELLGKMYRWILKTYDVHKLMLDKYESVKNDLVDNVDELISNSINKYNDTPQGEGDFSGDNHATNVTISQTTTSNPQKKTNIEKLVLINEKLKNIYEEWAQKFMCEFLI